VHHEACAAGRDAGRHILHGYHGHDEDEVGRRADSAAVPERPSANNIRSANALGTAAAAAAARRHEVYSTGRSVGVVVSRNAGIVWREVGVGIKRGPLAPRSVDTDSAAASRGMRTGVARRADAAVGRCVAGLGERVSPRGYRTNSFAGDGESPSTSIHPPWSPAAELCLLQQSGRWMISSKPVRAR
jgi:hypothetical protein